MNTQDDTQHEPDKTRTWLVLLLSVGGLIASLVLLSQGLLDDKALAEARHLEAEGDFEGAGRIYRERLTSDPRDVEAVKGLAVALTLLQRYDEALPYQQQAVRLEATDSQLWVELGLNYLGHQGRPAKAVEALRTAANLDPSARNRSLLGQALFADGRGEEAEKELRSLIAAEPDFRFAYLLLAKQLEKAGRADDAAAVAESAAARGMILDTFDAEGEGA